MRVKNGLNTRIQRPVSFSVRLHRVFEAFRRISLVLVRSFSRLAVGLARLLVRLARLFGLPK